MHDLEAIKHELFRLRSVTDIQNLMGRYTVNHTPKNIGSHVELFAMHRADVSVEIGDRGVYVGAEAVRRLFQDEFAMALEGNLLIHYLATPMIEVSGDGLTAKGVWRSPGIEAVAPPDGGLPVALWSFGAYACDFVFDDGRWQIWHLHWFRTTKCSFSDGWVNDLSMARSEAIAHPDVQATSYHNPYTPSSVQDSIPPCPEPFETWTHVDWAIEEQRLRR